LWRARGDLVRTFDSDDLLLPGAIHRSLEIFIARSTGPRQQDQPDQGGSERDIDSVGTAILNRLRTL
jgi:hypothetical protein